MNDKYDNIPFCREVRELFWRMPVMRVKQFLNSLTLLSGMEGEDLEYLVRPFLIHGIVLFSENGYATVKENLDIVAWNLENVRKDGEIRIGSLIPWNKYFRYMDCYDVVMEFYPKSENFTVTKNLFPVTFTDMEKDLIYEIIRIPVNKENVYNLLIKKESMQYSYGPGATVKDSIRRIAIVENEACVDDVPYCGFTKICIADPKEKRGFRLAESRKGDLWKDMIHYTGMAN